MSVLSILFSLRDGRISLEENFAFLVSRSAAIPAVLKLQIGALLNTDFWKPRPLTDENFFIETVGSVAVVAEEAVKSTS